MSYLNKPCFIVLVFLCTWCIVLCVGEDEKCIKGIYHKDKPSEESDKYKFCTPWKKLSCCTTALDNEIAQNDAPKKYNDSWHLCGNLSKPCLKYWKQQVFILSIGMLRYEAFCLTLRSLFILPHNAK